LGLFFIGKEAIALCGKGFGIRISGCGIVVHFSRWLPSLRDQEPHHLLHLVLAKGALGNFMVFLPVVKEQIALLVVLFPCYTVH
jgi:hypothetical protein